MRNINDILTEIMKKENLNDQDIFFETSIKLDNGFSFVSESYPKNQRG